MRWLQPTTLALAALFLGSALEGTALRNPPKNIPWETVRALIGGRHKQVSAPAHAPGPSASPAAGPPANAAPQASPKPLSAPAAAIAPAPAPAPTPALVAPMALAPAPVPAESAEPPSMTTQAVAPAVAPGPAAAHASAAPAAVKGPCPCPPVPAAPGNVSVSQGSQDLQDVARETAVESIEDASEDAKKDSQSAIANAGRQNLRGVQQYNDQAVDEAGNALSAHTDEAYEDIASSVRKESEAGQNQLDYQSIRSQEEMRGHLDQASRKTMAFYIHAAKAQLGDLKEKMEKSGVEMTNELKNSIAVGSNAGRVIGRLADGAEVEANYSRVLWANTQREVREAQKDANFTEDSIRTSAMGTKFSSQAVEKATEASRKAYDMATQANLTGNMVFKKVMKTKGGIEDVSREVEQALKQASKANIDALQAEHVATKLNKDAQR